MAEEESPPEPDDGHLARAWLVAFAPYAMAIVELVKVLSRH